MFVFQDQLCDILVLTLLVTPLTVAVEVVVWAEAIVHARRRASIVGSWG